MIYKKGRSHRVLVCPECGVLATNGLGKWIGGAVGSIIPGAGTVAGATIGGLAEKGIQGLKARRQASAETGSSVSRSRSQIGSGERAVNRVLYNIRG